MKTVGLALGGGGAKGLAHVLMLEVFDELGLRPARIAGTSIGAIVGAVYASGQSAERTREQVEALTMAEPNVMSRLFGGGSFQWLKFAGVEWQEGGIVDTDAFLSRLHETIGVDTFEKLQTPLSVVATDFWKREAVVIDSGDVVEAVRASMALPGIFKPVVRDDRVLVDGGPVNPLPYDLVDDCDVTVAIDVLGRRTPSKDNNLPTVTESIFQTYSIMEAALVRAKRALRPPTIYVAPDIEDVRLLEFNKAELIFEQAQPAKERLRNQLLAALG